MAAIVVILVVVVVVGVCVFAVAGWVTAECCDDYCDTAEDGARVVIVIHVLTVFSLV